MGHPIERIFFVFLVIYLDFTWEFLIGYRILDNTNEWRAGTNSFSFTVLQLAGKFLCQKNMFKFTPKKVF